MAPEFERAAGEATHEGAAYPLDSPSRTQDAAASRTVRDPIGLSAPAHIAAVVCVRTCAAQNLTTAMAREGRSTLAVAGVFIEAPTASARRGRRPYGIVPRRSALLRGASGYG